MFRFPNLQYPMNKKFQRSAPNHRLCKLSYMTNIEILIGDIATAETDAIVNAANPKMLGGGGVDGTIHKAAGPKLLEACRKIKSVNGIRCPFGDSRITQSGKLRSRFVIQVVGPIYRNEEDPANVLRSAYESAANSLLKMAANLYPPLLYHVALSG